MWSHLCQPQRGSPPSPIPIPVHIPHHRPPYPSPFHPIPIPVPIPHPPSPIPVPRLVPQLLGGTLCRPAKRYHVFNTSQVPSRVSFWMDMPESHKPSMSWRTPSSSRQPFLPVHQWVDGDWSSSSGQPLQQWLISRGFTWTAVWRRWGLKGLLTASLASVSHQSLSMHLTGFRLRLLIQLFTRMERKQ